MIARGFRSVLWVGAVGGAALGCYMVSLRVATERADLARVEGRIVDARRDIRALQTELGTRGRLNQLEEWNSNVLALSAPSSAQFVGDAYALARLQTRQPTIGEQAGNVRLAAAETAPAPAASAPPAASADKPAPHMVRAIAPAAARSEPAAPVRRASFVQIASADRIGGDAAPAASPDQPAGPKASAAARPARKPRHSGTLASAVGAALRDSDGNGGGGAR